MEDALFEQRVVLDGPHSTASAISTAFKAPPRVRLSITAQSQKPPVSSLRIAPKSTLSLAAASTGPRRRGLSAASRTGFSLRALRNAWTDGFDAQRTKRLAETAWKTEPWRLCSATGGGPPSTDWSCAEIASAGATAGSR